MTIKTPHDPHEWFREAKHSISDEGVFSEDQIQRLKDMIDNIERGLSVAMHGYRQRAR